jgi:hypothetical protein
MRLVVLKSSIKQFRIFEVQVRGVASHDAALQLVNEAFPQAHLVEKLAPRRFRVFTNP